MAKLKDKHCFTIEITLEDNQESLTKIEIEDILADLGYFLPLETLKYECHDKIIKNVDYKYTLKCYGSQS